MMKRVVSYWVCMASAVTTKPAMPIFSSQGADSADFVAFGGGNLLGDHDSFLRRNAVTRCVYFPSFEVAPRAVLPLRTMALPATGAWVFSN